MHSSWALASWPVPLWESFGKQAAADRSSQQREWGSVFFKGTPQVPMDYITLHINLLWPPLFSLYPQLTYPQILAHDQSPYHGLDVYTLILPLISTSGLQWTFTIRCSLFRHEAISWFSPYHQVFQNSAMQQKMQAKPAFCMNMQSLHVKSSGHPIWGALWSPASQMGTENMLSVPEITYDMGVGFPTYHLMPVLI